MRPCFVLLALVLVTASAALAVGGDDQWPGAQSDGRILLPNGWSLDPAGEQIALSSDLPIRMSLHPGGRFLAIQHAGFREHLVAIFDTEAAKVVSTLPIPKSWSGMAWSPDGKGLLASGGVDDLVYRASFDPATGALTSAGTFPLGDPNHLDLVAGMSFDGAGRLWTALQRSDRVVRTAPDGSDPKERRFRAGAMPFECVASTDGKTVFVSLWGRATVVALDAETGVERFAVATGQHPSEMLISPDGKRLFVSNASENTVTIIDLAEGRAGETVSSALYPKAPPGSTPNSVALTPDGRILLIANADNNNCALFDVSEPGHARSLGFVPLGWYPTSLRLSEDGTTIYAANGKGSAGSLANPLGPESPRAKPTINQYIGGLFLGSLSIVPFPEEDDLGALSARAYACSPLQAGATANGLAERPADSPIPAKVGAPSPIKHCVYIIKENRTYDQVLGDDPRGNGDPSLCIFGNEVSPNHHALASDFVLLDNYYVNSEVSADGHEWTMGAYATDFVERTWPVSYGGKAGAKQADGHSEGLGYPSEGSFAIATPKSGYLWDMAKAAGVTYRSYGEWVANGATPESPAKAVCATLEGHIDPYFRGWDLGYADTRRAERFLTELKGFEEKGEMPRLIVMRLPNDHGAGTSPGMPTPRAMMADNDLALGMVVEGLSKSRFWGETAIFVVEDDAQNGPDHVDAHRSIAYVVSPWVLRGEVVSEMYSTCGMLRTMELILGLGPMSQYDAAALPMYSCFTGTPDLSPYECRPATYPRDEMNKRTAWGSDLSLAFDFSKEDAADDLLLNEVTWRSVKGADCPMPMPVRAAFVRVLGDGDEAGERED